MSTSGVDMLLETGKLPQYNPWDGVVVTPISGEEHQLNGISVILAETAPGGEVPVHEHPFQEIFIVREGEGRWTVGDVEYDAVEGDIVIAPANTPHRFVNAGDALMRHTSIQLTGSLGSALHRGRLDGHAADIDETEG